jgi:hypothetical protein
MGKILASFAYKLFMNLCIVFSAVVMAGELPLRGPDYWVNQIVKNSALTFGSIFVAQMLLEMAVNGVYWNGPQSYLRDNYGVFDFILNIFF